MCLTTMLADLVHPEAVCVYMMWAEGREGEWEGEGGGRVGGEEWEGGWETPMLVCATWHCSSNTCYVQSGSQGNICIPFLGDAFLICLPVQHLSGRRDLSQACPKI